MLAKSDWDAHRLAHPVQIEIEQCRQAQLDNLPPAAWFLPAAA
jgi:hypothetical protein